ncbi:hypothetical protein ACF3NA_07035 [Alkanindiges sp. WGS2144]|uniref:hypothetical protein n=1 Tax=Alkanindiges sp. WGS2144 TaxID=3366808 RepID=UPI0037536946
MTGSKQTAQALAQQLLEAQIIFIKSRLKSATASHYASSLIDFCLTQGKHITLEQVVSPDSIKEVVRVYAFELNLGGGMMELIGAMARRLYSEANQLAPTLQTLINDQHMEQWIDKILELDQVREHIIQAISQSSAAHEIIIQVTSSLLKKQLPDWRAQASDHFTESWIAKTSLMAKLQKLFIHQEEKFISIAERQIGQFVQNQSSQLLSLDADELKDIAWQVWQNIKHIPLNELSSGIESLDIEEFFVLIYELWRHLRQTEYLQRLILTGVDVFFEVYGQYPVAELLEEIGISKQHLLNDANRFLPQAISALNQHHVLDQLIRLQLTDFYQAADTLRLIQNAVSPQPQ